MNHGEWNKEVRKALIDKELKVVDLCNEFDCSDEYIYSTISGRNPRQNVVDMISAFLGVESYEVAK